jgi:hypothetical protein
VRRRYHAGVSTSNATGRTDDFVRHYWRRRRRQARAAAAASRGASARGRGATARARARRACVAMCMSMFTSWVLQDESAKAGLPLGGYETPILAIGDILPKSCTSVHSVGNLIADRQKISVAKSYLPFDEICAKSYLPACVCGMNKIVRIIN